MGSTRTLRRAVCGIVLLAVLYAQWAIAAYACPAMQAGDREAGQSLASMPCAGSMAQGAVTTIDLDQAALCLEHCKAGSQAVDASHAPSIAAPVLFALIVLGASDDSATAAPAWMSHARVRDRAPPRPHSILHCCWRV